MDGIRGLGLQWFVGLLLLSRVGFVLLLGMLVVAAPLWFANDLLSLRAAWWADWTFYTSPVWAPFWVGYLKSPSGEGA